MNTWEMAILKSIQSLGGKAGLQQIYKRIPYFNPLTEKHRRETRWGRRPAYQHQARSHISNLRRRGELIRTSRGCYSLTEEGIRRIDREMGKKPT